MYSAQLLKLDLQGSYCDPIGASARANVSYGIVLLVRAYIIEQALVSIQVCDKFDISFMESPVFASQVESLIKDEMQRYQVSFDTLEGNLYDDLLSNGEIYYQTKNIIDTEQPQSPPFGNALHSIIREQVIELKQSISTALNLGQNWSQWDEFVTNKVFPTYDTPSKPRTELVVTPPITQYESGQTVSYKIRTPWGENPDPTEPRGTISPGAEDNLRDTLDVAWSPDVPETIIDDIVSRWDAWNEQSGNKPVWSSTYESDTPVSKEYEYEETVGSTKYKIKLNFTSYVSNSDTEEAQSGKDRGKQVPTRISWSAEATVDGEFASEYFDRITDYAIYNPFYPGTLVITPFVVSGLTFERYIKFKKPYEEWEIDGVDNFIDTVEKDIRDGKVKYSNNLLEEYDYIRFGLRLNYVDFGNDTEEGIMQLIQKLSGIDNKTQKHKAYYLKNQTRFINGRETEFNQTFDYISIPLINSECEYTYTGMNITVGEAIEKMKNEYAEKKQTLQEMMWQTNEYRVLFDISIPIKDIISSLSVYQYSALSDSDIFLSGVDGTSLHEILAKTKLSTLQLIVNAIYSMNRISYVDPFLQKAEEV